MDEKEFRQALKAKIYEEVEEFFEASDQQHRVEEMGDILEVLRSVCGSYAIFMEHVVKVARDKREQRGGFDGKIFLEGIDDGLRADKDKTTKARPNGKEPKEDK